VHCTIAENLRVLIHSFNPFRNDSPPERPNELFHSDFEQCYGRLLPE